MRIDERPVTCDRPAIHQSAPGTVRGAVPAPPCQRRTHPSIPAPMSVVARLLSSGVARGFAALLALLLSAVIGGRLGVDRLSLDLADDENTPIACPLVVDHQTDLPVAVFASGVWSMADRPAVFADLTVSARENPRPFPGLLRGSAGGPRAP